MNGEKTTKRVWRWLLPWDDEKEERWLAEQARSGWRLTAVRCFGGYTFERAAPAEMAYRLDVAPSKLHDRSEYFGLFRDAGWQHLGHRGLWQFFAKEAADGRTAEIYTDNRSKIGKYRRILAFLGMMMAMLGSQLATNPATTHRRGVTVIYAVMLAIFLYFIVRVLLRIRGLKAAAGPQG
jgi:Protein of unknown function (DUF2812)